MCPKGIEATFYALVLAIINAGYLVSYWLGGALAFGLDVSGEVGSFENLPLLIIIAGCVPIVSLICLLLLPKESEITTLRSSSLDDTVEVMVSKNMRDSFE